MNTVTASSPVPAPAGVGVQQSIDDGAAGATNDDPPDHRSSYQGLQAEKMSATSPPVPINLPRRIGSDSRTSPLISYSPGTMEGGFAGSVSDYDHEHELDSPSSLSSWNSWAGGRRGDLADVEDFELESAAHEPELETVSELDEESSSFCSGSDRLAGMLDSDDDARSQTGAGSSASGSRHSAWNTPATSTTSSSSALSQGSHDHSSSARRKQHRLSDHLTGQSLSHSNQSSPHQAGHTSSSAHHHAHYASHLHPHGTPSFPHFSPRAGGHGLSHHSRYLQRAPPNVAARRRKGRLAELAEEGGSATAGDGIKTTTMPTTPRAGPVPDADVPPVPPSDRSDLSERSDGVDPSRNANLESLDVSAHELLDDCGPTTPTPNARTDFEIFGPPPPPMRCVSPSETVPVVPSPLCECVNAPDEDGNIATETEAPVEPAPAFDTPREERSLTPTNPETSPVNLQGGDDADATIEAPASGTGSPPSPTMSGNSLEYGVTRSTPPTTPPTSPLTSRSVSIARRMSSPTHLRSSGKKPLRPCFKRGSSTQSSRALSSRDSSVERGDSRGRTKVRFSPAPPVEVRTHSPVDYDRKACPINNRLSADDLEELRSMKMEMGLLEAKCAALAAVKSEESAAHTESESETEQCVARWTARVQRQSQSPGATDRKRAESISSSSPTTFCAGRFAKGRPQTAPSPADYLRMEREKERERVCRMAGIGVGAGFRYTGGGGKPNMRQMPHGGCEALGASLVNRWGLSKPPPPLPGLPSSAPGSPMWTSFPASFASSGQDAAYEAGSTESSGAHFAGGISAGNPPLGHACKGPSKSDVADALSAIRLSEYSDNVQASEHDHISTGEELEENDQIFDEPRGRSSTIDLTGRRKGNNDSASTDATITPSTSSALAKSLHASASGSDKIETIAESGVPSFTHTAPSPSTSPDRPHSRSRSPVEERLRNMYGASVGQGQVHMPSQTHGRTPYSSYQSGAFPSSPKGIHSIAPLPPVSPMPSRPSFGSGYDSPASEFYESGSEYDLVG